MADCMYHMCMHIQGAYERLSGYKGRSPEKKVENVLHCNSISTETEPTDTEKVEWLASLFLISHWSLFLTSGHTSSTSGTVTTDYLIMDKSADYVHAHHSFLEPKVTSSDCVLCPADSQKPQWLIFYYHTKKRSKSVFSVGKCLNT